MALGNHGPLLMGHRGACAERPENTIPSFERALAIGVDVLETDVHMTGDGVIVVSHDPDGRRMAGTPRRIAASTWAEVRGWDMGWGFVRGDGERPFAGSGIRMPRLVELLDRTEVSLNVDIKQRAPSMVEPLLNLLRDRDAEARVTLASFHHDVIQRVRAAGYRGPTVLSRREVIALLLAPRAVARALAVGDRVQIPLRAGHVDLGSGGFIRKCHAVGLAVDYWTINDPAEAAKLCARGADGIITDDPAALKAVLNEPRLG